MLEEPIPLTARLLRGIEREYPEPEQAGVVAALERVDLGDWRSTQPPVGRERVLAAVLVLARGEPDRLARSIRDAERDWRDVLVWAGLSQPDWPERLAELLGPT